MRCAGCEFCVSVRVTWVLRCSSGFALVWFSFSEVLKRNSAEFQNL